MVGRNIEIGQLKDFINSGKSGKPGILFVSGPAGIGKTTLLQEELESQKEILIYENRQFETNVFPFGPVTNILRFLLKEFPEILHSSEYVNHLHLLLPEIEKPRQKIDQNIMISAIKEVFIQAAQNKPFLFVLEDIHWMDAASIEIIPHLFSGIGNIPLMGIATYRNELVNREHRLTWLKNELRRIKLYQEINLKALNQDETKELTENILNSNINDQLTDIIFNQTQGLPFFIEELAQALYEKNYLTSTSDGLMLSSTDQMPIPGNIRDMIAIQLDGLSESARAQLQIAALLGEEFEFDLLNEIYPDEKATDELLQYHIIYEKKPGTGSFRHSLVREDLVKEVIWSKRKELHHRIAKVLEKRRMPAELVGDYYLNAGEKEKAQNFFVDAAIHYCNIHAHRDSSRAAQKALDLWPKGQNEEKRLKILENFSQCAMISGQIHHSIMALQEISESPLIQDDLVKKADTFRSLAISYALQGSWHQYKKAHESAASYYEKAKCWKEASQEYRDLANRYIDELDLINALETINLSVAAAKKTKQKDIYAKALSVKGYIISSQGNLKEGQEVAKAAVDIALKSNHIETVAYTYRKLAGTYEYSSNYENAITTYDQTLNFCRRENINLQATFCLSCMSWILFRLGEWKRSLEVSKEVIDDPNINDASKATAYLVSGLIRIYRGELKSAEKKLKKAYQLAYQENFKMIILIIKWAMAIIPEFEGENEEAYHKYLQMIDYWQSGQDKHDIMAGLFSAVSFFSDHGYEKEINQSIRIFSEIANETNNPEAIGGLAFAIGEASMKAGNFHDAIDQYEQALHYCDHLNLPLQAIQAEYKLGRAFILHKQKEKGVTHLQNALKKAKNMGIRPLAQNIINTLNLLEETKSEPRSIDHESRQKKAGLTRRQFEIIKALAEGLSNKEIAVKYSLSTRTVDMHVANILNRFNCRTRTEAVKIAMEQGLISEFKKSSLP